jgi:hypothetical protein
MAIRFYSYPARDGSVSHHAPPARNYSATAGLNFLLATTTDIIRLSRAGKKPVGLGAECRVYWMLASAQPLHPVGRLAVRLSQMVRAEPPCREKAIGEILQFRMAE